MITTDRRLHCRVSGVVQGVGFRPYVYRLACEMGLSGWVRNDPAGVEIEIAGPPECTEEFLRRLPAQAPPAARITGIESKDVPGGPVTTGGFVIRESGFGLPARATVMADLATCPECLREILDPANRRYRYPFTNCTNCGPRFSIITAIPYDRPHTTMAGFTLCPRCRAEYEDPSDRRFHAQPNACPACGPRLRIEDRTGHVLATDDLALVTAGDLLRRGGIVALKGVGGYHLMADARSEAVVAELRRRKHRHAKPLAVMFPSVFSVAEHASVSESERELLLSPAAPIVLLGKLPGSRLASGLAPGQSRLGVLLPYSPLHHLLLSDLGFPLVATSGNLSEDPICHDDADARSRLGGIADLFLMHDRPIARPVDDSVMVMAAGRPLHLRRSRGFAPLPIAGSRPQERRQAILAVGGHLKNAPALAAEGALLPGPHVGDLGTESSRRAFELAARSLPALYDTVPQRIACDCHPDYASTRFAEESGLGVLRVQHHHAHILAVMAEHDLRGEVLGVSWDGTGWGPDGTVWGGEFLLADERQFRRFAHFRPFPLPGGDAAIQDPRRVALGLVHEAFGSAAFEREEYALRRLFSAAEWATLRDMLTRGLNCPRTSSAGRLFDGVAALLGLATISDYEGQAASLVEQRATAERDSALPLTLREDGVIDWAPMLPALLDFIPMLGERDAAEFQSLETACADLRKRIGPTCAAFHNALARMIVTVAGRAGRERVVLGGGCFQNVRLLETAIDELRRAGFTVYWPREVPPNDGGLSTGQLWAALHQAEAAS